VNRSPRVCLVVLALVCGLAAAPSALALPHLSQFRTREFGTLVNRFVNDVVRRQDLADGWRLAGPELRGGTTRKAWVAGRNLPVQQFDVRGRDFRKAWYAKWVTRSEIGLVVSLRVGKGANREMLQEDVVLVKRRGRWLVDSFYTTGIFRLGAGHNGSCPDSSCKVTGLADYAASSGGVDASARPHLGQGWLWVILGAIAGLPVALLVGIGVHARSRNRRAEAAYLASRSP
jgi:hypothetical protein